MCQFGCDLLSVVWWKGALFVQITIAHVFENAFLRFTCQCMPVYVRMRCSEGCDRNVRVVECFRCARPDEEFPAHARSFWWIVVLK